MISSAVSAVPLYVYAVPVVVLVLLFLASSTIKILREYERAVVFTLGRFERVKGPGLVLLIPFAQEMVRVDLRIQVVEIPTQDVISRDNVSMKVDAVLYFNVGTRQANCTQARPAFGICRGHSSVPPPARPAVRCPEGPHGLGGRDVEPAPPRPRFVCHAAGVDRLGSTRSPGLLRHQAVADRRLRSGHTCRTHRLPRLGRF